MERGGLAASTVPARRSACTSGVRCCWRVNPALPSVLQSSRFEACVCGGTCRAGSRMPQPVPEPWWRRGGPITAHIEDERRGCKRQLSAADRPGIPGGAGGWLARRLDRNHLCLGPRCCRAALGLSLPGLTVLLHESTASLRAGPGAGVFTGCRHPTRALNSTDGTHQPALPLRRLMPPILAAFAGR